MDTTQIVHDSSFNNSNRHYSFIEILPYDVLLNIFELLSKQDCMRASQVCAAWQRFILRLPTLWRTLSDRECNIGSDLLPYAKYIQADDVRELVLYGEGYSTHAINSITDFIVRQCYRNIQKALFGNRMMDRHILGPLVNLFGQSLTSLKLFNDDQPSWTLPSVLNQCPNLRILEYLATIYPDQPVDLSSLQPHQQLHTLNISFFSLDRVSSYRIYALMLALLRKLRKLEQIFMNPEYTSQPQMFHILRWYTPTLKTIVFSEAYPSLFERLGRQENIPMDETLNIAGSKSIHRSDVVFLLEKNSEFLKVLDIKGIHQLTTHDMIRIVNLNWPALRELHLGPHSSQVLSTDRLSQFLYSSPLLEIIEIVHLVTANDQTLLTLCSLRHLVTICFDKLENMTFAGLTDFLMNASSRTSLQALKLTRMDAVTVDVFELAGNQLPALQLLDISGLSFSMPMASLQRFTNKNAELNMSDPEGRYGKPGKTSSCWFGLKVTSFYDIPRYGRDGQRLMIPDLFDDLPGDTYPGDLSPMPLDTNPFMEDDVPYLGEQHLEQQDSDHQSDVSFDWFDSNDELELLDD